MSEAELKFKLLLLSKKYFIPVIDGVGSGGLLNYPKESLTIYYIFYNYIADILLNSSVQVDSSTISLIEENSKIVQSSVSQSSSTSFGNIRQDSSLYQLFLSLFSPLNISVSLSSSNIVVTLPNNEVKTFSYADFQHQGSISSTPLNENNIYFSCKPAWDYKYSKLVLPYWKTRDDDVRALVLNDSRLVGDSCYWDYDSSYNTIIIRGFGWTGGVGHLLRKSNSQTGDSILDQMITTANSCVFSSLITSYESNSCFVANNRITSWVFMNPENQEITLESEWFCSQKSSSNSKPVFEIYTDNLTIRNYSFSSNITVNFHSLSEWKGPLVS